MSRNRYTKLVRKEQRIQVARQEKELRVIARRLRRPTQDVTLLPESEAKPRRRARLERRRLDMPARYIVATVSTPAAPTSTGTAA